MNPPLHCPTCGAPLAPPTAMQFTCSYCHALLGITAQPQPAPGETAVVRLHGPGSNKILVIKAVRELTGLGLKESKDLVEGAMPVDLHATRAGATLAVAIADLQSAGAQYEVLTGDAPAYREAPARETASLGEPGPLYVTLVRSGPNKIEVIKTIRQVSGLGLKESKDLCDVTPSRFAAPGYTEAQLLRLFQKAGASIRIER